MFNMREITKECAKGLLLLMNAFCILISLITFVAAVVDIRIFRQYGEEEAFCTFAGDMVLIAVCVQLIVVAMMGCVGVVKEHVKILYLYSGFIMILVLLELMVGIYIAETRWGVHIRVKDWLREDFFRNLTGEALTAHEKHWDELQTYYECCGLNGPDDYIATNRPISLSCCSRAFIARTEHAQKMLYDSCIVSSSYYIVGCEENILYSLAETTDWLLGIGILSFWFEVGGLLMAMWVANNIKNSVTVYKSTVKY